MKFHLAYYIIKIGRGRVNIFWPRRLVHAVRFLCVRARMCGGRSSSMQEFAAYFKAKALRQCTVVCAVTAPP
jgi:hypothetical protein